MVLRGEMAHGTLLVTGVSPRPDAAGEQFVTITGVINGPTVNEHVIYQRLAVDVDNWPTMGELFPVVYSPKQSGQLELRAAGAAAADRDRRVGRRVARRRRSAMAMPMASTSLITIHRRPGSGGAVEL